MKTLYIDCKEGLQEEMILGSLFELCQEKKIFLNTMNHLFTSGLLLRAKPYFMNGIEAVRIQILSADLTPLDFDFVQNNPYAADYDTIISKISALHVSEKVKTNATIIFESIRANFKNSVSTEDRFFYNNHYYTFQSLFFVLGASLLIEMLNPAQIIAELPDAIHNTETLHSSIGLYFLKHFCNGFFHNPHVKTLEKGIGVSTLNEKDLFVYSYLGEMTSALNIQPANLERSAPVKSTPVINSAVESSSLYSAEKDSVLEISCNLDDMTGEQIGYAFDLLLKEGALDVFYTPIYMKKSRPGILLTCLCRPFDQDKFTRLFFLHTTTRGVRYKYYDRSILSSSTTNLDTIYGSIRQKDSYNKEIRKSKLEYDDVKKAADMNAIPLLDVYNKVQKKPF